MKTILYSAFALFIALAVSAELRGQVSDIDENVKETPKEDFAVEDFISACGCCSQGGAAQTSPIILALDLDKDGQISALEIKNAAQSLSALDEDNDGTITRKEMHASSEFTNVRSAAVSNRKLGVTTSFYVRKLLSKLDTNENKQLEKSEMSDAILAVLPMIDSNDDEILTALELKTMVQTIRTKGADKKQPLGTDRFQGTRAQNNH